MDDSTLEEFKDVPFSWVIEELMIEEYFLLVRRIPGIALSIEDYWELDTWTTSKLLTLEREIIKQEEEAYSDKKEYTERPDGNSEEMNDLVDEMTL